MANDTITSSSGETTKSCSDDTLQGSGISEASTSGAMDMLNKAYGYQLPSEEDRKREQKRRKQEEIASGISDAVRAMSNLFFASQGAPNMYDTEKSQTKQLRERWEKADKEERTNARGYLDGYLKILAQRRRDETAQQNRNAAQRREKQNEARNGTLVRNAKGEGFIVPQEVASHNFMLDMASYLSDDDLHSVGLMRKGKGVAPLGTTPANYRETGTIASDQFPNRDGYNVVKWGTLWDLLTIRSEENDELYDAMYDHSEGLYDQRYETEDEQ